jgi:hypothetical protein
MVSGVCAAQQFGNVPDVKLTYGRVTSILSGSLQGSTPSQDILYVNAPTSTAGVSSTLVGELLNEGNGQFYGLELNQITFNYASNVVAALGNFGGGVGYTDYAFAISGVSTNNLCVYYGTGAVYGSGNSSYNNGGRNGQPNWYPPVGGKSGCTTLPTPTTNPSVANLPNFTYIAALPFKTGGRLQLIVEDSANKLLYVIGNTPGSGGDGTGMLYGFTIQVAYPLPADGAGPIYFGDFNGGDSTDFIINSQAGHSATVYTGDGTGVFTAQPPLTFGNGVYSMLLQDMDGATDTNGNPIPDMVVEGADGGITIYKGDGNGHFTTNIGGTAANTNALTGTGGHLAAISNIDGYGHIEILTTTPIGLSVLENSGSYSPTYTLKNIYNIGSGHSSFALADFRSSGTLDLAVDSAEGVAIAQGDGNGGFKTNLAYSALAPALGATVGHFTSSGNLDVVAATDATKAQLLTGNGLGAFTASANPTNNLPSPNTKLWSNILSGDFNGDKSLDLAYSLTGNPLPAPGTGSGLYIQYGNGDGTFQAPVAVIPSGASGSNTLFGESVVGYFDKSGNAGIANIDANYDDTLLWQSPNTFNVGLNLKESNTSFNQVAAGYFKTGSSYQDLIFQQGATTLVPYKIKQDGSGTFTPGTPLTVPSPAGNYAISTVLLTDIDGDGNGDILALYHNLASIPSDPSASTSNYLYIWWGEGGGTFNSTPFIMQLSRNYYLAAVADMNGDTLPDLVLSDGYLVSILYNQTGRSFVSDFGTCTVSPCGETHFLAGQGINSLTLQSVRGGKTPDLVVANGGATISNPIVLGAAAQTSANLPANSDVNTGGITVLLNGITALQTTGSLAASPEPSIIGEPFTITATLIPTAGEPAPTGTVTFYLDGTPVSSVCTLVPVTLVASVPTATCTVPAGNTYGGGVHPMTAVYGGDQNNAQTTLTGLIGTHNILDVTTTTQIFFCIGPAVGCPAPPAVVNPPAASSLTMFYGQYWNGIIQTSDTDGSLMTGTVDLNDNYNGVTSTLCTLPVGGGACDPSVGTTVGTAVGTNILTGVYLGDASHEGSSSAPVAITVLQDTTSSPTLAGSPPTSPVGQRVTFTATLTGNYAPPTGTVTFYELNPNTSLQTPIGTGTLTAGSGLTSTATFTTSSLPVGTDSITASYAATTDFAAASFPIITENITSVNTTDFTVSATPNPASAGVGYATLLTVTVTANNGFTEAVNLSCGNLPTEATCTFAPPATPSGGGITNLIVETTAPHSCGTTQPYFLGANRGGPHLAPFALPALAGLVAFLIPGKRRWLRSLMALIVVAAITQMTGCSTCTDLGTKPATYTFQVIGTSAVTGEVQSQTVTLNITI